MARLLYAPTSRQQYNTLSLQCISVPYRNGVAGVRCDQHVWQRIEYFLLHNIIILLVCKQTIVARQIWSRARPHALCCSVTFVGCTIYVTLILSQFWSVCTNGC